MVARASRAALQRPRDVIPSFASEIEALEPVGGSGVVAGIDEVGRGALAGPVVVGACCVQIREGRVESPLPPDVRDSKLLTARRRELLVEPIAAGAHAHALGWASSGEIDEHGIMEALALAALRALDALGTRIDAIVLDGSVDILSARLGPAGHLPVPRVLLRVAADRHCRSVAAASILAKVARDRHMTELAESAPDYGWASNKGYAAAVHREAIRRLGPHVEHRRSWNLQGTSRGAVAAVGTSEATAGADVLWSTDAVPAPGEGRDGGPHVDGLQEASR